MTGWASALAGVLLAGAVGSPVFAFGDPTITESSGLVDAGRTVFTVNDSGDGPVLYAVDSRTGATTGTTTYSSGEVVDVEALAPGPDGAIWVGDIGDNLRRRDTVTVYRVTPGRSDAARFELGYPDGPRDAETLLAHPRTGQLFVVSKTVFGGVVYAAPRRLDPDRTNRLRAVADVPGFLTDGAFLPDGEHLLLRGYGDAWLLGYPDFGVLGRFGLPDQEQGEGLSVGPGGRILVSSEGEGAEVLEVALPARLRAAMEPAPEPTVTEPAAPESATAGSRAPEPGTAAPDTGRTVLLTAAGALAAAGLVAAVRSRRRSPAAGGGRPRA